MSIRIASLEDAAAIRDIYAPFVISTATSFEYEVPSVGEMMDRVEKTLKHHPWLVFEKRGSILGYAYASNHRSRTAYQWCVESSVYVHAGSRRKGIGRTLYRILFDLLRRQGFLNVYAGIALPNAGSVGLHEAMGFQSVGVYHKIGYKCGAWHDVGWWQLCLDEYPIQPESPIPFCMIRDEPEVKALLQGWSS